MTKLTRGIAIACFTTLLGICSTVNVHAQGVKSSKDSSQIIFIQTDSLGPSRLRVEVRCKGPSGSPQVRINDPEIGINEWENNVISRAYCNGRREFRLDGMYWQITD